MVLLHFQTSPTHDGSQTLIPNIRTFFSLEVLPGLVLGIVVISHLSVFVKFNGGLHSPQSSAAFTSRQRNDVPPADLISSFCRRLDLQFTWLKHIEKQTGEEHTRILQVAGGLISAKGIGQSSSSFVSSEVLVRLRSTWNWVQCKQTCHDLPHLGQFFFVRINKKKRTQGIGWPACHWLATGCYGYCQAKGLATSVAFGLHPDLKWTPSEFQARLDVVGNETSDVQHRSEMKQQVRSSCWKRICFVLMTWWLKRWLSGALGKGAHVQLGTWASTQPSGERHYVD